MDEIVIREFSGRIIGRIQPQPNGDKIVRDFHGRILGYYRKSLDATTDFYGRIVARGDACSMLIQK